MLDLLSNCALSEIQVCGGLNRALEKNPGARVCSGSQDKVIFKLFAVVDLKTERQLAVTRDGLELNFRGRGRKLEGD